MTGILLFKNEIYDLVRARNGTTAWYCFILKVNEQDEETFSNLLAQEIPLREWSKEWMSPEIISATKEAEQKAAKLKTFNRKMNRNAAPNMRKVYTEIPKEVLEEEESTDEEAHCLGCNSKLIIGQFSKYGGSGVEYACKRCHALVSDMKCKPSRMLVETNEHSSVRKVASKLSYSRLKSFLYYIRRFQGLTVVKASRAEINMIRCECEKRYGYEEVSYDQMKLIMYDLKDCNHLYSSVYSILACLGYPQRVFSKLEIAAITSYFKDHYVEGEKSKLLNKDILLEIIDVLSL